MSFILNALRKSEQERLSSHTETLEDKIIVKQDAVQKNKPGWLMILIIINLLLLALLLWHFTRQEEEDIIAKPAMLSEQTKAPTQINKEKPVTTSKQAIAPTQIADEKTVSISEQPITPLQIIEKKPVRGSKQLIDPIQVQKEKSVQAQDSKLIIPTQVTIAQQIKNQHEKKQNSLKTDQITRSAKANHSTPISVKKSSEEQEIKNQKPDLVMSNKEKSLPYLSEMPYEFRLSVPNININVFVYTDHPSERFIMVNMLKYQVGEQINNEMELQEIRPNSIVVKYKDKIFQIKR